MHFMQFKLRRSTGSRCMQHWPSQLVYMFSHMNHKSCNS
ncbi:hypothetical protein SOVF_115550 [Spinacia oleracea]|nr:hypothetical protein SOVF_115550 [Spinacia oleracea]